MAKVFKLISIVFFQLLLAEDGRTIAQLQPSEVAILYNSEDTQSQELAIHYANLRKVPKENVFPIRFPLTEEISRAEWENEFRPTIKNWLNQPEQAAIRCLVTTWGVPLRIGAWENSSEQKTLEAFLQAQRAQRLNRIFDAMDRLHELGKTNELVNRNPEQTNSDFPAQLNQLVQRVGLKLKEITDSEEQNEKQKLLQAGMSELSGLTPLVTGLNHYVNQNPPDVAAARSQLDFLRGRGAALEEAYFLASQFHPSPERDTLIQALLERVGGHLAVLDWLNVELGRVVANDSSAALDSELALIKQADYRRIGVSPNYLNVGFDGFEIRNQVPTLMVARLDGPSLEVAKSLVDRALAAEKAGSLAGRAYIDARGLEDNGQTSVEDLRWENSLRGFRDQLARFPAIEVVIDSSPMVFQPASGKEAVFYCGGYSPGKYLAALEFKPGAIAYHLSPGEARELRSEGGSQWCKSLLADGATATIGSVHETSFDGFPEPGPMWAEFLAGNKTLVECFFRYRRSLSDSTLLIGDPLYRMPSPPNGQN